MTPPASLTPLWLASRSLTHCACWNPVAGPVTHRGQFLVIKASPKGNPYRHSRR